VSSSVEKQGPKEREYVAKSVADKKTEKKTGENRIIRYFRETYYELKRVSWPTRSEALNLTVIVIVVTTFMAIILGLMDWVFSAAFGKFFSTFGV
jgi:preprotein translocase subunit SecE